MPSGKIRYRTSDLLLVDAYNALQGGHYKYRKKNAGTTEDAMDFRLAQEYRFLRMGLNCYGKQPVLNFVPADEIHDCIIDSLDALLGEYQRGDD